MQYDEIEFRLVRDKAGIADSAPVSRNRLEFEPFFWRRRGWSARSISLVAHSVPLGYELSTPKDR